MTARKQRHIFNWEEGYPYFTWAEIWILFTGHCDSTTRTCYSVSEKMMEFKLGSVMLLLSCSLQQSLWGILASMPQTHADKCKKIRWGCLLDFVNWFIWQSSELVVLSHCLISIFHTRTMLGHLVSEILSIKLWEDGHEYFFGFFCSSVKIFCLRKHIYFDKSCHIVWIVQKMSPAQQTDMETLFLFTLRNCFLLVNANSDKP